MVCLPSSHAQLRVTLNPRDVISALQFNELASALAVAALTPSATPAATAASLLDSPVLLVTRRKVEPGCADLKIAWQGGC
jgi:hypothetical protein